MIEEMGKKVSVPLRGLGFFSDNEENILKSAKEFPSPCGV